jgi:hypothetical protein
MLSYNSVISARLSTVHFQVLKEQGRNKTDRMFLKDFFVKIKSPQDFQANCLRLTEI